MTRAFLALGANLGERLANLQAAVERLHADDLRVVASSSVYETEPVGPPQPDYLNVVVEIETTLDARGLLARCQEIERALGRVRGERWGARTIDVDILSFGDEHIDEPDLIVPHPRMGERAFVLVPLAELTGREAGGETRGVRRWGPPLAVPTAR